MAIKIKLSYLAFFFILITGLFYKLILPATPHLSASSIVQPLYYIFVLAVVVFSLIQFRSLSIAKSERNFIILTLFYYTLIFFSSWMNITISDSNFSFEYATKFLFILFVCFSGIVFGNILKNNESLTQLCAKIFSMFIVLLLLKVVLSIGFTDFFYLRPFTLQTSLLSMLFLFFLPKARENSSNPLILFVIIFMFVSSGSRTILVSTIMIFFLYIIFTSSGKGKVFSYFFVIISSLAVIYMLINFADDLGRFSKILFILEDSRMLIWSRIFEDVLSADFNWLYGRGYLSNLYVLYSNNEGVIVNTPHNTYLYLFYYTGIAGLIVGTAMIFYIFINVELIFKLYLTAGFIFMLFNDSLLFPHSFSYIVDYWFFFFFLSYFWKRNSFD